MGMLNKSMRRACRLATPRDAVRKRDACVPIAGIGVGDGRLTWLNHGLRDWRIVIRRQMPR